MAGFVKIDRRFNEWEWASSPNMVSVFIHCLIEANYKDKRFQGIEVPRGSFVMSLDNFAKRCGITVQQLRTCLKKLEETGEIIKKSTNKFTVISVCNYCKYQDEQQTDNKQITNEQQTDNKQITTRERKEEGKNILLLPPITRARESEKIEEKTNEKEIDEKFEEFWGHYTPIKCEGRFVAKGSKAEARKKFGYLLKSGVRFAEIMEGLRAYLAYCRDNNALSCGATVFLNQRRWEDDYTGAVSARGSPNITPKGSVYEQNLRAMEGW